jgi:hypothetical protein
MPPEIELIWLIDNDPPSPRGGKAFYPATPGAPPPDADIMRARFAALRGAVAEAGVTAVATLHTSPRHRCDFFEALYVAEWHACLEAGIALALHPHEDLADGGNRYGGAAHLARVVADSMARARDARLPLAAFRSGAFAWNPALPAMLEQASIRLDLSPGPGLQAWPATPAHGTHPGTRIAFVPIGSSGAGGDLDADYLFLERMDFARLARVWSAMRARVQRTGQAERCNLLTHGFGLADPAWRALALRFLDHIRARDGMIIGAAQAMEAAHADHA